MSGLVDLMSELAEVRTPRETVKYNEVGMRINEAKPTKIVWGFPDTVEMTDKDGKIHTYSIIELLDGIKAFADWFKETKEQEA